MAQLVKNLPAKWETWVQSLLGRSPGEGKGYPLQYSGEFLLGLQSMGSQRVGHDWATFTFTENLEVRFFRLSLCKQTCHSSRGLLYSTGNYSQHLVLFLVAHSCPVLCDPMACSPPGYSVHRDSPTQSNPLEWVAIPSSRVSRYQDSNPGLPHCRWILCHLSHQGSPRILEWVAYPFLQGIFPTQESKQGLLHCRQILYQLPGKPQYFVITYNGK